MIHDLSEILFLDIETVPAYRNISEVPEDLKEIWIESNTKRRKKKVVEDEDDGEAPPGAGPSIQDAGQAGYDEGAGLKAEFGKTICVSLGHFEGGTADENFRIYSLSSHNESEILTQLAAVFEKYSTFKLCAHNGKGFDFPFLGKRFLINGIPLPSQLDIMGKKPWDILHLDTNEMWAFGARGAGTGAKLKLLCAVFGIPSPKDDIDGSEVRGVYYEENDLPRIVKYCEKDVISLAKVFKKLQGFP